MGKVIANVKEIGIVVSLLLIGVSAYFLYATFKKETESTVSCPVKNMDTSSNSHSFAEVDSVSPYSDSVTVRFYSKKNKPAENIDSTFNDTFQLKLGREISHKQLPTKNFTANTRIWLYELINTFSDKDYITGKEIGLYYQKSNSNKIIKKIMTNFFEKNISKIQRNHDLLVIYTTNPNGIKEQFKIPLVVNVALEISHQASIQIKEPIASPTPLFENWAMLPLNMKGIKLIQGKDTIPSKGYINGDFYYIQYPTSKLGYKLK